MKPRKQPGSSRVALPQQNSTFAQANSKINAALDARPLIDYTVIRTVVLVLAALGVVMVMSSSMATSFADSSSVWATAGRQSLMVLGGLILFWAAMVVPQSWIYRAATVLIILSVALLVLVLVIGVGGQEVGSQSWLQVGPLRMQPSELARIAIALWGAKVLTKKDFLPLFKLDSPVLRFIMVAALCIVLIGAQGDFGMMLSFAIVVVFVLWFAGANLKFLGMLAGFGLIGVFVIGLRGGFRSQRFHTFFDAFIGKISPTDDAGFQSRQGYLSLADGSLFGVGLGQSRAKWFYLPEARNDFIFAIIGEELGLWGGAMVILLFTALAFFGFRTARRAQSRFHSLAAASLTAAVVSQAFINIGYVVGWLPVTGIQLPMLSAGGTSAVITLGAMGVLASFARHEPDAVSAMQNYGRPLFDRVLFVPEPKAPAQMRGSSQSHARQPRVIRETTKRSSSRPSRNVSVRRYDRSERSSLNRRR